MDDALIDEIYEFGMEPDRGHELVSKISSTYGGAAVYLARTRRDRFGDGQFWTEGVDPTTWNRFGMNEQTPATNRSLSALLRLPPGLLFDRREFIPDEMIDRDPVPRAFLTDAGLYHATIGVVHDDERAVTTFWVARSRDKPIEADDLTSIRTIGRHLGRALKMNRALDLERNRNRALSRAFDDLDLGVAFVDQDSRIVYANGVLERFLAAGTGFRVISRRLCCREPYSQGRLSAAVLKISQGIESDRDTRLIVSSADGEVAYLITLARTAGNTRAAVARSGTVMMVVKDLRRPGSPLSIALFKSAYDLTKAEACVAALAGQAKSIRQIAAIRKVSVNTVKSQMKAIYGKTGTRSLADLTSLISTISA